MLNSHEHKTPREFCKHFTTQEKNVSKPMPNAEARIPDEA
jgi:hypothetical protein